MKKWIALLLAMLMLVGCLTACGAKEEAPAAEEPAAKEPEATEEAAEPEEAPAEEEAAAPADDGTVYTLRYKDGLYIGRGSRDISFASADPEHPAKFYLNSCPAHKEYPTVYIRPEDCVRVELGSLEQSNHRTICKYILPGQVESCQLVMGMTQLQPGSVWNTMPCHTHDRRMEVYLYFDMPKDAFVMHYMGEPQETRHIVMRNEQAVISPSWSIHAGSGSQAYTFIWGMCGENQDFDDMDGVATTDIL